MISLTRGLIWRSISEILFKQVNIIMPPNPPTRPELLPSNSSTKLESLNDQMLLEIFGHLDAPTLLNITETKNRRLYHLANEALMLKNSVFAWPYILPKEVRLNFHRNAQEILTKRIMAKEDELQLVTSIITALKETFDCLINDRNEKKSFFVKLNAEILSDLIQEFIAHSDNYISRKVLTQIALWANFVSRPQLHNQMQYIGWLITYGKNVSDLIRIYEKNFTQFSETQALCLFFSLAPKMNLITAKEMGRRFIPVGVKQSIITGFEQAEEVQQLLIWLIMARAHNSVLVRQYLETENYRIIERLHAKNIDGDPNWLSELENLFINTDYGLDINIQDSLSLQTAISKMAGRVEYGEGFARGFIKAGAFLDLQDMGGYTPLIYAIKLGNFEMVCLLIAAGASLDLARHKAVRLVQKIEKLAYRAQTRTDEPRHPSDFTAIQQVVLCARALDHYATDLSKVVNHFNNINFAEDELGSQGYGIDTTQELLAAKSLAERIFNTHYPQSIQGLETLTDLQQVKDYLRAQLAPKLPSPPEQPGLVPAAP